MSSSLISTLLLLTAAVAAAQAIDCSAVLCARPLCANPVTPPGDCCPSCEDSNCKFEGCVNFLEGGPQWSPNPCQFCQCDIKNNQQFCAVIACRFLTKEDCFGYPVVQDPDRCCPSCDFGKPDIGCHVVPQLFSKRNITVTQSVGFKRSCTTEIIKHTCDKVGFRYRGKKFGCRPLTRRQIVRFDKNCPLSLGLTKDVTRCKSVQDNTVSVGCDLVIKN